jgi:hypothetical protein
MKTEKLIPRSWYYFRIGYNTYLVFLLGYGSTLITVYYLAVKNIPELLPLFSRFWFFAVLATTVGVPTSIMIGWIHTKRSGLLSAEMDISVEANPYNYKLVPGYWKEVAFPAYLETLRLVKGLSEKEGLLTTDDKSRIEKLEGLFRTLAEGGYVGSPRRRLDL